MKAFLISLFICSALMSIAAFICMGLERALKKVWSARRRAFVWAVIAAGFLTPVKPRLTAPIYTVPAARYAYAEAPFEGIGAPDIWTVLFFVWLCGAAVTAGVFLLRQARFRAYVRRFSVKCGERCAAAANETADGLGVKRPEVMYLRGIASPMLTGLFSPVILLPYRTFREDELRLILKHELVHFKRRDLWRRLAFLVCRTAHWFNPAMPVFCKAANTACELACDERVTADVTADVKKRYCEAILFVAAGDRSGCAPVLASGFGGTKEELKDRFRLILNGGKRKGLTVLCAAAVAAVAFSGALFAVQPRNDIHVYELTTTAVLTAPFNEERDTAAPVMNEQAGDDATEAVMTAGDETRYPEEDRSARPAQPNERRTTYPYVPVNELPEGFAETTTVRVP